MQYNHYSLKIKKEAKMRKCFLKIITAILLLNCAAVADWRETGDAITAPDGKMGNHFGQDVAIGKHFAAIGAPEDNDGNGSVYLYEKKNGGEWVFLQKLESPYVPISTTLYSIKSFGFSVALAEKPIISTIPDLLVIGAPESIIDGITGTKQAGAICAYERNTTTGKWEQGQDCYFELYGGSRNVGYSVDATSFVTFDGIFIHSHAYLLTGVPEFSSIDQDAGKIIIIDFNTTSKQWNFNHPVFRNAEPGEYQYFGHSVALDNADFIVGAPGHNRNDGMVSWWHFNEADRKITAVNNITMDDIDISATDTRLGTSVALAKNLAAAGALHETDAGSRGAVYIFHKNDHTGWTSPEDIIHGSDDSRDDFGKSIAFDGFTLAVGAPSNGFETLLGRREFGSVYLYECMEECKQISFFDGVRNSAYGTSVALYSEKDPRRAELLIGAPGAEETGKIRYFDPASVMPGLIMYLLQ